MDNMNKGVMILRIVILHSGASFPKPGSNPYAAALNDAVLLRNQDWNDRVTIERLTAPSIECLRP